ncbi:MAG TPA: GNAT family N-acetyltransferase [Solirubrobacteraceae bacterium]
MVSIGAREGGPDDQGLLLALFDEAVRWLLARGQTGQWGAALPSREERWRGRVRELVTDYELHFLELDGNPVGAVVFGAHPSYVEESSTSELYIELLITARSHRGEGLGHELLALAERTARRRGLSRLRLDCWAGAPTLVGWYESEGFRRCGTFARGEWMGQLLARPVPYAGALES